VTKTPRNIIDLYSLGQKLSVPCRPGIPAYRLKSKTRRKTYYHMPYSSESCLPAREGSSAATCPMAADLASLLRRALALPRVPWHRPRRPAWEGFGAAMCLTALDPASLLGRVLTLPCTPRLQTPPPWSGGLRRCHVFCGSLWAVDLKNKERLSWPTYAANLACFHGTPACF
jgi:hypothetical protein